MFLKPTSSPAQPELPLWQEVLDQRERDCVLRRALTEAARLLPVSRTVRVEWRRYPATAGRAYPAKSLICLSSILLTTEDRIRETALHEYAHLYVYEQFGGRARPHGPEWRAAMNALGLPPDVTHDYDFECRSVRKPYVCACHKCGAEIRRARPLKRNRVYRHIRCGGTVKHLRMDS